MQAPKRRKKGIDVRRQGDLTGVLALWCPSRERPDRRGRS
jgi:hypothetical protein